MQCSCPASALLSHNPPKTRPAPCRYSGTAAALATLALFAAASFADPGTVTAANLAAHQALYPYDGLVYPEAKDCWTCGVPRPARSKHCSTCGRWGVRAMGGAAWATLPLLAGWNGMMRHNCCPAPGEALVSLPSAACRCIARLDHHCIWLNSCVGLGNTRWFLAFLLATAALCSYGAVWVPRGWLSGWDAGATPAAAYRLLWLSANRFLLPLQQVRRWGTSRCRLTWRRVAPGAPPSSIQAQVGGWSACGVDLAPGGVAVLPAWLPAAALCSRSAVRATCCPRLQCIHII